MNCELLKRSVLFRLRLKAGWSNSAKVKLNEAAVLETIGPAPVTMTEEEAKDRLAKAMNRLKGGQKLLVSPEYDAIKTFQNETKARILETYCNPSFIDDGLYCVKTEVLPNVIAELKAAQTTLKNLVAAFVAVYSEQIEAAKPVLGEIFNPKLYPLAEKLLSLFDITWSVVQLDIPEGLPPEIREEEEKKLRDTYAKAEQAIMGALWTEFQKLLTHITDRLTPGEDGKKKKFNADILGNLSEFVSAFNNRNTFNDGKLAELVAKADQIVATVTFGDDLKASGEKLRTDENLRNATMEAFSKVKSEVDKTVTEIPSRAFDFSEDAA